MSGVVASHHQVRIGQLDPASAQLWLNVLTSAQRHDLTRNMEEATSMFGTQSDLTQAGIAGYRPTLHGYDWIIRYRPAEEIKGHKGYWILIITNVTAVKV